MIKVTDTTITITGTRDKRYYFVADGQKQDCEDMLRQMRIPYELGTMGKMISDDFIKPENLYPDTFGACEVLALNVTKEDLFEAVRQSEILGEKLNIDTEDIEFVVE